MKQVISVLVAAFTTVVAFSPAHATMPALTKAPGHATLKACLSWAHKQDEDAVYMWGMKPDGSSSADIATLRLALSCLGEKPPEIVGYGSSAGFDEAYCKTHSSEKICSQQ